MDSKKTQFALDLKVGEKCKVHPSLCSRVSCTDTNGIWWWTGKLMFKKSDRDEYGRLPDYRVVNPMELTNDNGEILFVSPEAWIEKV